MLETFWPTSFTLLRNKLKKKRNIYPLFKMLHHFRAQWRLKQFLVVICSSCYLSCFCACCSTISPRCQRGARGLGTFQTPWVLSTFRKKKSHGPINITSNKRFNVQSVMLFAFPVKKRFRYLLLRGIIQLMNITLHQASTESWFHVDLRASLVLCSQAVWQSVQSRVEGSGHVGVGWVRPLTERWSRAWGEAVDKRCKKVGVTGLAGLDQTVDMDAEGLLLKGAWKCTRGKILQPGEQRQIQFIATVPAEQVYAE